jgi:hypothetical protein
MNFTLFVVLKLAIYFALMGLSILEKVPKNVQLGFFGGWIVCDILWTIYKSTQNK